MLLVADGDGMRIGNGDGGIVEYDLSVRAEEGNTVLSSWGMACLLAMMAAILLALEASLYMFFGSMIQ
jgi:hypothetical protein